MQRRKEINALTRLGTTWYYYFIEKLKIVEKNLCKLNCSYSKVSDTPLRFMVHMLVLESRKNEDTSLDHSHQEFHRAETGITIMQ